jgi:hypothetical protein
MEPTPQCEFLDYAIACERRATGLVAECFHITDDQHDLFVTTLLSRTSLARFKEVLAALAMSGVPIPVDLPQRLADVGVSADPATIP